MDVRAVILLGGETLAKQPLALVPVLGKSVLERSIEQLQMAGVGAIRVIAPAKYADDIPLGVSRVECESLDDWSAAEHAFDADVDQGAEVLIFARVGSYAEIDWKELIECHTTERDRHTRVTRVWHRDWPLDIFIVNASRRNEAAALLRSQMQRSRSDCTRYAGTRYVNMLRDARDLRQLAQDGLYQRCSLRPAGLEVRPGVWLGEDARIERGARVVAPAFIGKRSRVYAGAAVTRGSSVEHHSIVDCGTVLEDTTILPFSRVGVELELAHTVVNRTELMNLRRNTLTTVHDPTILASISSSAGLRFVRELSALAVALPKLVWNGLFEGKPAESPRSNPAAVQATRNYGAIHLPEAESVAEAAELADFAVMRRYGNQ